MTDYWSNLDEREEQKAEIAGGELGLTFRRIANVQSICPITSAIGHNHSYFPFVRFQCCKQDNTIFNKLRNGMHQLFNYALPLTWTMDVIVLTEIGGGGGGGLSTRKILW